MHGSEMSGSCCQMRSDQTTVVADAPVLPRQSHAQAFLLSAPDPISAAITSPVSWHAREASPPLISPGTNSILRI